MTVLWWGGWESSSAETLRRMQELEHKNVELQGELTDKLRKEVQGKNKLVSGQRDWCICWGLDVLKSRRGLEDLHGGCGAEVG